MCVFIDLMLLRDAVVMLQSPQVTTAYRSPPEFSVSFSSSVVRASHQCKEGHGFKSNLWTQNFFIPLLFNILVWFVPLGLKMLYRFRQICLPFSLLCVSFFNSEGDNSVVAFLGYQYCYPSLFCHRLFPRRWWLLILQFAFFLALPMILKPLLVIFLWLVQSFHFGFLFIRSSLQSSYRPRRVLRGAIMA